MGKTDDEWRAVLNKGMQLSTLNNHLAHANAHQVLT